MKIRRCLALAAPIALTSCSSPDLSGTYVGKATGFYELPTGRRVELTLPNETLIVTTTSHHYQGYTYRVTVRGCTLDATGKADNASFHGKCAFDLPTIGRVAVDPAGGVTRNRKGRGVQLTMGDAGLGGKIRSFGYILDARPQ